MKQDEKRAQEGRESNDFGRRDGADSWRGNAPSRTPQRSRSYVKLSQASMRITHVMKKITTRAGTCEEREDALLSILDGYASRDGSVWRDMI